MVQTADTVPVELPNTGQLISSSSNMTSTRSVLREPSSISDPDKLYRFEGHNFSLLHILHVDECACKGHLQLNARSMYHWTLASSFFTKVIALGTCYPFSLIHVHAWECSLLFFLSIITHWAKCKKTIPTHFPPFRKHASSFCRIFFRYSLAPYKLIILNSILIYRMLFY